MFTNSNEVYANLQKQFYLAKIEGSEQEFDLTLPANCNGFGRVRHFRRNQYEDWIQDPLPIDPAIKYLKWGNEEMLQAQCFQIAQCNLNCWYCFVPQSMKKGRSTCGAWLSADQMVSEVLKANDSPRVIALSGGNPELVPTWPLEIMKSVEKAKVIDKYYIWSDDALSTDYFHIKLTNKEIGYMTAYPGYGKVCCFKGYNETSCNFNVQCSKVKYEDQLKRFSAFYKDGFDLYGYVTFTTPDISNIDQDMRAFFDDLRTIHPMMPLRIVPLRITMYNSIHALTVDQKVAYKNQFVALNVWQELLNKTYSTDLLNEKISNIII